MYMQKSNFLQKTLTCPGSQHAWEKASVLKITCIWTSHPRLALIVVLSWLGFVEQKGHSENWCFTVPLFFIDATPQFV